MNVGRGETGAPSNRFVMLTDADQSKTRIELVQKVAAPIRRGTNNPFMTASNAVQPAACRGGDAGHLIGPSVRVTRNLRDEAA